jgi:hypothetical protein
MKKSVVRIHASYDSETTLEREISSLSSEHLKTFNEAVTLNALKQVREDPKTYEHLKILTELSMKDIQMFEIGNGWKMSLDDKEKEKYRNALFFAKKEMSVVFSTRSRNTNLLFLGGDDSGYIAAIKGFKFADIGKDEGEWEGNTIVYFFGIKENKSIAMAAIEYGTHECTNKEDATRLICTFMSKYGAMQYPSRVCCVCNKIGDAKEFRHCSCNRQRRYCSEGCQSSDWATHKPEHVTRMLAFGAKAEDESVPASALEKLSVSEEKSSKASQGAASSAVEHHSCVVCGAHSTLACRCGTRYCSKSCQRQAWPAHKLGCSGKPKA